MGIVSVVASSPTSSIMFLIRMERSATSRSVVVMILVRIPEISGRRVGDRAR